MSLSQGKFSLFNMKDYCPRPCPFSYKVELFMIAIVLGLFQHVGTCYEVSVSCMMAYDEGGAPAVLKSLECPQWALSNEFSSKQSDSCQYATLQGRRKYQEDRVVCNSDIKIPILDNRSDDVTIGFSAIFDGHGGKEASEMASQRFLDFFFLHAIFNIYKSAYNKKNYEIHQHTQTPESADGALPITSEEYLHGILEEALLKAFKDIDSEFTQEALENGYIAGSTATVLIRVNDHILVGHVGDSKALLCSHRIISDSKGTVFENPYAEELTRDHHPDRDDEKARIEEAGGFVRTLGVPRVNGVLAVSRAIGDVPLKRYGVTAEPEITSWRALRRENIHLVVASDGIFENMSPGDVCDVLSNSSSSCSSSSSSLADCIVRAAYVKGSTDNLSAIVMPLNSQS